VASGEATVGQGPTRTATPVTGGYGRATPDARAEVISDRAATVGGRAPSPFSPRQLARLDEALTMSSRETGLHFSVYVGRLDEPTRQAAEALHSRLGEVAAQAVLIAVSPGQRVVHVVTGEIAFRRLPDRACALAVLSMEAAFSGGDLIGGIVNGLRMLSDQAGRLPAPR